MANVNRIAAEDGAAIGLWRSDIKPTLTLGLPLVGAQLAQMAINTTDVVMIGWLGAEELAAAVLAFNLFILFWFFGMGVTQAVIPLAARAVGQKTPRDLRRVVRMGLWVVALYCLPVWVTLSFTEQILVLLGQDPEISRLAGGYMLVMQWTLLPSLAIMALRAFLTVMECTQILLWTTLGGAVVNAGLDYVLIFGLLGAPRLELVGAAIASVFTASMNFVLLVVYVTRHRRLRRYTIFGRLWRSDWPVFFQIVRFGWPIGTVIVAEGVLFSGSAVMMGWIGTLPLAAHGIALQIASIVFMVPVGLSQAGMARVGLAMGRGDLAGIGRAGWTALGLTLGFMGCAAVTFWTVPDVLVSLFLDFDNPQAADVLAIAVSFLSVAALFQLFDGAQISGGSMLRGLGDTVVPLVFALLGYWVIGVGLSYGLAFGVGLGGIGIWWGLAGGLAATASMAIWRFANRERLGLVRV
ncbi:MATE family efflux transporter [Polymorphum gilvum]|uniref:Multidrug-efflux transporter n=1 Tax=Polymorphum gilvum (strain LMG 25793 / CGMCC 1.9160 / SL003B-26A1) TaxID=991905 RepID=F2IX20_POLGS|nr:MATE family efflux transporter [Polymorphum gilvum]ADZ69312.1 MATE efflux family protein [Polymorphum gilvum SL003B-26A1]